MRVQGARSRVPKEISVSALLFIMAVIIFEIVDVVAFRLYYTLMWPSVHLHTSVRKASRWIEIPHL